jgi:hypothetical protein
VASSEDRIRGKPPRITADLKPEEIQSWAQALVGQRREDLGREYMNVQCVLWGPGYVTAADIIQSNDDTYRVTPSG